MNNLKHELLNFKKVTVAIIESLEKDDLDSLNGLFNDRETLIQAIDKMVYTKDEFAKICYELQMLPLQQKLTKLIRQKQGEVKNSMDKFLEAKSANMSYKKGFQVDSIYFNKKI